MSRFCAWTPTFTCFDTLTKTEPSGAASYAGLLRLLDEGKVARDERVVLLVTGSGLKSIDVVIGIAGSVIPVEKGHEGMVMVADLYATMENKG